MTVQTLYFGLLPLLLIGVAFSSHTTLRGKSHPLFSLMLG